MAIKQYKPTSPGRRGATVSSFADLTKKRPESRLLAPLRRSGGRNNQGKITVRHRGGGAKRTYRLIDFKRNKVGVPGKVSAIEYDPNRSARIALIVYVDGDKRYILSPNGLKIGDPIMAGEGADVRIGNAMPLNAMPLGTVIHAIELTPGKGAQMVRSAGASAQLMARDGDFATLRLPSGEMRRVPHRCIATIGQVGNVDHQNITLGKAGRTRHLGIRPSVRGAAMNPIDHPHGGGEGKAPVGLSGPKTPWGKPALGYKTRKNKLTAQFIIKRRGQK